MICRELLVMPQERLNVVLGDHVEADRRLVEKQHLGRVQQGGDQLHLHPLAERQFAHRLPQQRADLEQFDQFVARAVETGRLDAIDLLVQAKRLLGGQVPPQLVLLPHDQREPAAIGVLALPRDVAHARGPCRPVG